MYSIKLKDASIVAIETDADFTEGCPTCGFCRGYCTNVEIKFDCGKSLSAEYTHDTGYNNPFGIGYFVMLFCNNLEAIQNMTMDEFASWFVESCQKDFPDVEIYY